MEEETEEVYEKDAIDVENIENSGDESRSNRSEDKMSSSDENNDTSSNEMSTD